MMTPKIDMCVLIKISGKKLELKIVLQVED